MSRTGCINTEQSNLCPLNAILWLGEGHIKSHFNDGAFNAFIQWHFTFASHKTLEIILFSLELETFNNFPITTEFVIHSEKCSASSDQKWKGYLPHNIRLASNYPELALKVLDFPKLSDCWDKPMLVSFCMIQLT